MMVEETKEEIIEAIKLKQMPMKLKESIKLKWGLLGFIRSRCDRCGHVQSTSSMRTACIGCGKSYQIASRSKGATHIVWCPPGKEALLREIICLELWGHYPGGL